ncbi:V-type ATP synthase subunit D [Desulfogranum mediterraneum]|uniref:V-type ATP synthase subunit D n=1 Tax=Desulfogranum mediterraneum TaxID=160661 RepID=UPI000402D62F|nr:V-type ATP synthase subunit D [Desulfogranum mediterraneum]
MREDKDMPATRSTLIRLKDELAFSKDGLELLEMKKEILVRQISSLAVRADRVRAEMDQRLAEAYDQLHQALIRHGEAAVESAGLGLRAEEQLQVRERSLMGVVLPLVGLELPLFQPGYGLCGSGKAMDGTAAAIHRAMEVAGELAEVEVSVERLLVELKKTIKRINVLARIHVPRYQQTIKAIEGDLEEKEREALFRLRRIRSQSE